jgi:copper chaperone CopZ
MKYYIHEIPGRLRIKIPTIKKNKALAQEINDYVYELNGVVDLNINILTGSVVVNYDPNQVNTDTILGALAEKGHLNIRDLITSRNERPDLYHMVGEAASRAIIGFAIDRAFAGSPFVALSALV